MGTLHITALLSVLLVAIGFSKPTKAQMDGANGFPIPNRNDIQPQVHSPDHVLLNRVASAGADVIPSPRAEDPRGRTLLNNEAEFQALDPTGHSILDSQPQPGDPMRERPAAPLELFIPADSSTRNRIPAQPIGRRRIQNDPFGEFQRQQPQRPARKPEPKLTPPAASPAQDDPFGEQQKKRLIRPTDLPSRSVPLPTRPPQLPDSVVPFAEPPEPDQKLQAPVLPPDSQFSPDPGNRPELVEPRPRDSEPIEPAPRLVRPSDRPDSLRGSRDASNNPPSPIEPTAQPAFKENFGSDPRNTPAAPRGNVYVPPSGTEPRIVQPEQIAPPEPVTPDVPPNRYQPRPVPPPTYQPLYQPIPAFESRETDRQPQIYQPPVHQPQIHPIQPSIHSQSRPVWQSSPQNQQPDTACCPPNRIHQRRSSRDCAEVYSSVVDPCDLNRCECKPECTDFYFSFLGGWTGLRDLERNSGSGKLLSSDGSGFGFAIGRRNGRNLRSELNLSFHQNEIVGYQSGSMTQSLAGELTSVAGMANAYWELIDVPTRCFKPYVGVGIGFISIDSELRDVNGRSLIPVGMENDSSFAYQWMGGVNYKAYRNVDLYAEYRFLAADALRIDTTTSLSDRYEYQTDNLFLGLRWKF